MEQIAESDWKIFKKLHPVAIERFFTGAMHEIERAALDKNVGPKDRFWKIAEMVQDRRTDAREIFDDFRRSTALLQLAIIRRRELLTDDEMRMFSADARAFVQRILSLG